MKAHCVPFVLFVAACGRLQATSNDAGDSRYATLDASSTEFTPITTSLTAGIAPADVLSNVGTVPIAVWVDQAVGVADDARVQAIAASTSLVTYPELLPVPMNTTTVPGVISVPLPEAGPKGTVDNSPPAPANPQRTRIMVVPTAPLDDRWYAVTVTALPSSALPAAGQSGTAALGAVYSRFRTSSGPVRSRVWDCAKPDRTRVMVDFSEGMNAGSVAENLTVDGCTIAAGGSSDGAQRFFFDCPLAMYEAKSARVTTKLGIVSVTGVPAGVMNYASTTANGLVDSAARIDDLDFTGVAESGGCVSLVR